MEEPKVMCPASWQRRRANGCDSKCSHFMPHKYKPRGHLPSEQSCEAVKGANGDIICPACVDATPSMIRKATIQAMLQKMTKKFDYEEDEDDGR